MFYVKSKSTHSIVMYSAHHSNMDPHKNDFEISMGLALESLWVLRALRIFMVIGPFSSVKGPSVSAISMSMCVWSYHSLNCNCCWHVCAQPATCACTLIRVCRAFGQQDDVFFYAYLGPSASPVTTRAFPNTKLEDAFVGLHLVTSGRSKARSSVSLYQTFKEQYWTLKWEALSIEVLTSVLHNPHTHLVFLSKLQVI